MNYNVFDITVHKASQSVRVGITFESDEEAVRSGRSPRPWVKALHPYGLAASNGLEIGDEIVSINGERVNSPLIAAQMLREGQGDICLGVRRGPPPSRAPSERGAVLPPKLALAAAREEQERDLGEDIDLGQMTQRALRGIGDWFSSMGHGISQMLQPEHHAAATYIASVWKGYHCRQLLTRWRWASEELDRLRSGNAARKEATEQHLRAVRQHSAAMLLQAHARGLIDRQWVLMLRAQAARREEAMRTQGAEAAAALPDSRAAPGGAKRVEKAKRAFSFKRKSKRAVDGAAAAAAAAGQQAAGLAGTGPAAAAAAPGSRLYVATCPFANCGAQTTVELAGSQGKPRVHTRCVQCGRHFAFMTPKLPHQQQQQQEMRYSTSYVPDLSTVPAAVAYAKPPAAASPRRSAHRPPTAPGGAASELERLRTSLAARTATNELPPGAASPRRLSLAASASAAAAASCSSPRASSARMSPRSSPEGARASAGGASPRQSPRASGPASPADKGSPGGGGTARSIRRSFSWGREKKEKPPVEATL